MIFRDQLFSVTSLIPIHSNNNSGCMAFAQTAQTQRLKRREQRIESVLFGRQHPALSAELFFIISSRHLCRYNYRLTPGILLTHSPSEGPTKKTSIGSHITLGRHFGTISHATCLTEHNKPPIEALGRLPTIVLPIVPPKVPRSLLRPRHHRRARSNDP